MSITNITPRESELQKQVIELAESLRNLGWEFELYKQGARATHQKLLDKMRELKVRWAQFEEYDCNALKVAYALVDELKAKLAEYESREPVATLHDDGYWTWIGTPPYESSFAGWRMNVYTKGTP